MLRSPATTKTEAKSSFLPIRSSLLQRKCACGNSVGLSGQCSECQKKSLIQQQATDRNNDSEVPPIFHELFPLQTKLTVGKPDDIYEQEADRVAAQVMSMGNSSPSLQQKPEQIQTKRSGGEFQVGSNLESRLNSSRGSGSPLPDNVRSFMEPRFGEDFSQVRVHTDGEAVRMNRELNAQAFTHQQDIYFGAGKTPGNDALTAHELTHVVQQKSFSEKPKYTTEVSTPSTQGGTITNKAETSVKISRQSITNQIFRHTREDCDTWYNECGDRCRSLPKTAKARRALCWAMCMEEYATCLASSEEALAGAITLAVIVAAIVLASADGPFPLGDAAALALLTRLGISL